MKFVFINSLPTSKLFGEKINAWWYSQNGLDAEFWDVAPIFWPEDRLEKYYGGKSDYRYIGPGHRKFDSRTDIIDELSILPQDTVVWYLGRFYPLVQDEWIFDEFHRHRIRYYLQHFDTRIVPSQFFKCLRGSLASFKHRFSNRNLSPKGIVGSGRLGRQQSRALFPGAGFVSIPSIMIEWQQISSVFSGTYNLFVDESVEYAPDAKMFDFAVCHDTDGYYERLNHLFDQIEDWSGSPVVVAASGKYQYDRDRFSGRHVIYGQTLPLIQHSNLVIGHTSLALDQCLVSEKPILIIDDPAFTEVKRSGFADSLINLLQKPKLVTEVTRSKYLQILNPDIEIIHCLVRDYLKEDEVDSDYYSIVKNEVLTV